MDVLNKINKAFYLFGILIHDMHSRHEMCISVSSLSYLKPARSLANNGAARSYITRRVHPSRVAGGNARSVAMRG